MHIVANMNNLKVIQSCQHVHVCAPHCNNSTHQHFNAKNMKNNLSKYKHYIRLGAEAECIERRHRMRKTSSSLPGQFKPVIYNTHISCFLP